MFKTDHQCLTSIFFTVWGAGNVQVRVHLLPFLCRQFSELWQLEPWVQSLLLYLGFLCLRAHRMWLRMSPTAFEKKLKVLDYA